MSEDEQKRRFHNHSSGVIHVRSDGELKRYQPNTTFHEYRSRLPQKALERGDIKELPGPEERRERSNRSRQRSSGSSKSASTESKSTSKSEGPTGEGESGTGESAGETGE